MPAQRPRSLDGRLRISQRIATAWCWMICWMPPRRSLWRRKAQLKSSAHQRHTEDTTRAALPQSLRSRWSPPPLVQQIRPEPEQRPGGSRVRWHGVPACRMRAQESGRVGRGTAMIEMPREGSTLASVRQTTVSGRHPVRSIRWPQISNASGRDDPRVANRARWCARLLLAMEIRRCAARLVKANAASVPLVQRKGCRNRRRCSGVPPTTSGVSPSIVEEHRE